MRNGFILFHRQGLTEDDWKHPLRTLAWIDFLTMAAWDDFTADDGVRIGRGEVIASYGFLSRRWRVSKDTAFCWIKHWIAERQVERRAERCSERSAERFFVVNYAKYQDSAERVAERSTERPAERSAEQMKGIHQTKQQKENTETGTAANVVDPTENEFRQFVPFASSVLGRPKVYTAEGLAKWKARRRSFDAREIAQAFSNLSNEPDRWKITNNGHRELSWWLHSDERIREMQNCHLKGSGKATIHVKL
jgi:hypothetical protein